jgi:tRNA threonylcarbamoyladenosine biosynthesis protein TsaB
MRVLALDTTTRTGSVALVEQGRVVAEQAGDRGRHHAERFPGELLAILAASEWPLSSVDLFAVASGPGSFTGLRIGIATIQGLAFVERRPVVGVSALEALAQIGSAGLREGAFVGAWIDARRQDVFSALYRVADAPPFERRRLTEIEGPTVDAPAATIARWDAYTRDVPVTFLGDGVTLYRTVVAEHSRSAGIIDEIPLLAGTIGRMAASLAEEGRTTTAAGLQPQYVRRPDAEIERERRLAGR